MTDDEIILALSSNEKQALLRSLVPPHYTVTISDVTLNLFDLELVVPFISGYALTNKGYRIACYIQDNYKPNDVSIIEED